MGTSAKHTTGAQISVRGVRTRKRRSMQEKLQIVRETLSDESVAVVARRHGINANQLFGWRRQYQRGEFKAGSGTQAPEAAILPVRVTQLPRAHSLSNGSEAPGARASPGDRAPEAAVIATATLEVRPLTRAVGARGHTAADQPRGVAGTDPTGCDGRQSSKASSPPTLGPARFAGTSAARDNPPSSPSGPERLQVSRLRYLDKDTAEMLEFVPGYFKVICHIRENQSGHWPRPLPASAGSLLSRRNAMPVRPERTVRY